MTEFMPIGQVREYTISTGEVVDLAAMSHYVPNMAELTSAPAVGSVKVGDKVYALAMSKYRYGVVVKVGRTKVHVAFTTPGAISANDQRGVRVGVQAVSPAHVLIPAREVRTAPAETPDEILPAVQSEPEVSAQPAPQMTGRGLRTLVDASDVVTIRPEVIVPGLVRDGAPVSVEVPPAKAGQDFSPLPVEGTYRVAFGRVGRHESIPSLDVLVPAAEAWNTSNVLAEAVHAHVRRYLNSTWYTITVDLTYGRVLIQDGRFGEGKATLVRKSA